ncbi:MAG: DUF1934 domain-containing protein [Clostridia bacterium]|nr:DUF1934 domain-containing protein [Clostridia bacterium]
MSHEVRVRLKSVRYEVEASLFSNVEEEDGLQMLSGGLEVEPEVIEINTLGKRGLEKGRVEISYEETEATGMAGSSTAVSFMIEQPGVVTMVREGAVSTALVFESGKRHHCLYNTPFMPFEVCVHTLKVDNRLAKEKYLELDYIIEIRGARAERTKFRMEVL